jgi:hypothetical protein
MAGLLLINAATTPSLVPYLRDDKKAQARVNLNVVLWDTRYSIQWQFQLAAYLQRGISAWQLSV